MSIKTLYPFYPFMWLRPILITMVIIALNSPCILYGENTHDPDGKKKDPLQKPQKIISIAVQEVLMTLKKYPCTRVENIKNCPKQRAEIKKIAESFIDFDQVAKLSVGRYRRRFSQAQWDKFKELFKTLLLNTYMKRLQEYSGERVVYEKERIFNNIKAQVDTKVISDTKIIPVTYRLLKKDEKWKVYDILVEGVSLLKNYRRQFSNILRKKKASYLIRKIEKKLKDKNIPYGGKKDDLKNNV